MGIEEDDIPHKIFTREYNKGGVDEVLTLAKDNILKISWRYVSGDVTHLSMVDSGRIRMLLC